MEKLYPLICDKMEKFCHSEPAAGYEVTYLLNAEKILKLYKKAAGIVDEEENIEIAKEQLKKIFDEMNEIF